MNHSLPPFLQSVKNSGIWPRLRAEVVGLAQDFWKDGAPEPQSPFPRRKKGAGGAASARAAAPKAPHSWHADLPQVMEKIWGEGYVLPGGDAMTDLLTKPFGLNKEMSMLDLSAGLGGLARKMVADCNTYVTGMEADPVLARRGMEISHDLGKSKQADISVYKPEEFTSSRHYDCIVARELFYRVIGKERFFKAVASGLKSRGQIAFTDFILEKKPEPHAIVAAWLKHESATPLSLAEMTQSWVKLGFDMRVTEDQTAAYHHEIIQGLADFAAFLKQNPPDEATKPLILKETGRWAILESALGHGLKFYRFYAIKK